MIKKLKIMLVRSFQIFYLQINATIGKRKEENAREQFISFDDVIIWSNMARTVHTVGYSITVR